MGITRLGQVLKALREEREWTLDELAKRAKVTMAYISFLERGKRKNPSLAVLKRLAKSLRVPLIQLLG